MKKAEIIKIETDSVFNCIYFVNSNGIKNQKWHLGDSYTYNRFLRILLSESQFYKSLEKDYTFTISKKRFQKAKEFYEEKSKS